jgi:hypothetical protein
MRPLLFRSGRSAFAVHHRQSRQLFHERLEDRSMMSLVSYWSANNTAVDSVSGNNGTLYNGAAYAAGQIGQAFSFDGVNDRINVADSPSFKLTQSLSIEGWIKVNAFPSGSPNDHGEILFRGDDRGGLDPYSLSVEPNGTLQFLITPANNQGVSASAPIPLGQFIHVAATLEDATGVMRLYENGVIVSQLTTTVRPFADLDPASNPGVGIGNHGGYPNTPHNFPFSGRIDELKLYNEALSPDQILTDFNAGKGSLQPTVTINDTTTIEGDQALKYLGNLSNPSTPNRMIYGPDGNLYVTTLSGSSVLRYDGTSGTPLPALGKSGAEFVSPGAGGLDVARELAFGPDGNLYVVGDNSDAVLRFDPVTGNPLGALIPAGSGGLDQPRGLLFNTDGYLYVTSVGVGTAAPGLDSILRYDALTGAPAGISGQPGDAVFIASGSGGLDNPSHIDFHNGEFYIASTSPSTSNSILKYSTDGSFVGAFVATGSGGLAGPSNFVFRDGFLYVTSWTNNKVLRYDGVTGAFVDELVSGNGLVTPLSIMFEPNGNFLVTSRDTNEIRRYGNSSDAAFTVSLSAPFPTSVSVNFTTANGTALAGSDYLATSGTLTFAPGQTTKTILVPTLDDAAFEGSETFTINLTAPSGVTIANSQGVATITDNDIPPTKFYVADDGSVNKTFEYSASGAAIENYAVNSGNSAPRGAASTATGDKVWIVDANKNVYVYNTSGGPLGSWAVGGFNNSAQLEGITVNGNDVWIVDAKSDKVYRYTGAANLLSGSATAASSFSLNSSNGDASDLVTDGTSIWVLNNTSSTDKVFKYTVSGTLQGSWTISGGGGSPTGITLDPSNATQDMWIVDSSAKKVYLFPGARTTTVTSVTATSPFFLAPTNTNPQGLADPPPAGGGLAVSTSSDLSYDAALLGIVSELESLLAPSGKKRA